MSQEVYTEYLQIMDRIRENRRERSTLNTPASAHDRPLLDKLEDLYAKLTEDEQRKVEAQGWRVWPEYFDARAKVTPVRVGQKRATNPTPQARWMRVLGCYGSGSGGGLYSVTFESTFDMEPLRASGGLSENDILERYPHVIPPTKEEKLRLYEEALENVVNALHLGRGD